MNKVIIAILTLLIAVAPMFVEARAKTIDINKADAKTLTQLSGIGPKKAERIVKYRKTKGLFSKPKDIIKVPGIGRKIYEINKDRMVAGGKNKPMRKRAPSKTAISKKLLRKTGVIP